VTFREQTSQSVPTPSLKPTREEHAKAYLEHTQVSRATAGALVAAFLLTITAVPVVQHIVEVRANLQARRDEQAATDEPPTGRVLPQSWDVFSLMRPRSGRTMPTVADIKTFESELEEGSVVSAWLLPRAQSVLTGVLGAGNEQAYPGRNGWLHYRPDVDYVTGPGFLDPALLRQRRRAGDESVARVQPDPVRTLVAFHEQLSERGITLIVVPTPLKPMIEPETLSARYGSKADDNGAWLQSPSWPDFARRMAQAGVLVFDPTPTLARARKQTARPQFLRADTHWTPDAMERVALSVADFVRVHASDPPPNRLPTPYVRRATRQVENTGDIATMLKLPPAALRRLFGPAERVTIRPVRTASGGRWRARRDAEILLLGDSFSNIFSLGGMGWGEGAGLAEQLSFALQRPVDRIVVNAGGAFAARQRLRADLLRNPDRLNGKRVVIYQFAMRDLLSGDWKRLDLPPLRAGR
jgi:alginate O-acetyltransferase complex protein AlgJ